MNLRQNALALLVLTVLVAIAELWMGESVLTRLWQLPLGLLLIGLAYERWFVSKHALNFQMPDQRRLILGRTEQLTIRFSHSASRPLDIQWLAEAPVGTEINADMHEFRVPPSAGASQLVSITPRRLGQVKWPAPRARLAGPLGLAWWSQHPNLDASFDVVPELIADSHPLTGARGSGIRITRSNGQGHELLQLRTYREGDPPHLIDWKASARRASLVSREYVEDQHVEIVLAIDAGRASGLRAGSLDRLGHYANVAARFAQFALANDDRVGLLVFADRPLAAVPPGRGSHAITRIRGVLAGLTTQPAESNPLNAALRIRSLVRQRSLIVLLTDLEDATAAGQLSAAARLLMPKHLLMIAGLTTPEVLHMSQMEARSWLDPYEVLAAQEYCQTLERNASALRQLGAPTLLSRPDQLEQAVFNMYREFRAHGRI